MKQLVTILLTLIVINPFCACGAVRGDAHTVEKVAATSCGHDHCDHDAPADEVPEPCDCDHHADFISPPADSLTLQLPLFLVVGELTFSVEATMASAANSLRGSVLTDDETSPPAQPLWQRNCVLLL